MNIGKSRLNETNSPCINYMQYGGGDAVQMTHIINEMEDIQYRCVTPSVWRGHIISAVEGMQYGPVITSAQRRVTKSAQGVAGGCTYLEKCYFTYNITQISLCCDESRCF